MVQHNTNVIKAVVLTVLIVTAFIGIFVLYLALNGKRIQLVDECFPTTTKISDTLIDNTDLVPCQCGIKLKKYIEDPNFQISGSQNIIQNAIFGGEEAEINSIPWQVGLKVSNTFPYCGGTIIGPMTILTAAHCLDDVSAKNVEILVAEHDWSILDETNSL